MNLFCFGINYETATVDQRERIAFTESQLPEALVSFHQSLELTEIVILSTCNRTEFYMADVAHDVAEKFHIFLKKMRNFNFENVTYRHDGFSCVRHLFEVASGLQSMVVGETEILGQTKTAYEKAVAAGTTGKFLNKLFQHSFAAAKEARTSSGITKGSVSVASVSIELAEYVVGDLRKAKVLILGAGETGERVARTLKSKGAEMVFVANRTYERAHELALELGGEAVRWDAWEKVFSDADIVIASTAAPRYLLHKERVKACMSSRNYKPLFLIDLSMPRNIEPTVSMLDSVYLYDLDDLQEIANHHLAERRKEVDKCRQLLEAHEQKFQQWYQKTAGGVYLPSFQK